MKLYESELATAAAADVKRRLRLFFCCRAAAVLVAARRLTAGGVAGKPAAGDGQAANGRREPAAGKLKQRA